MSFSLLNRLAFRVRARYNARRRMDESKKCRIVGSVADWATWCHEVVKDDLPCDWVELRVDALPLELTVQEIIV